jgi:hypothetical protein
LWVGQGKHATSGNGRFVQKISWFNFGGFEKVIYTPQIGRIGYLQNLLTQKWLNMNSKSDKEFEKTL